MYTFCTLVVCAATTVYMYPARFAALILCHRAFLHRSTDYTDTSDVTAEAGRRF